MANHICPYWEHDVASYFLARERGGKSLALRPSPPHSCRKRAFRQGHALSGRFAGLDVHALASGLIYSRVTDEETSGGGSVKGSTQRKETRATRQKHVSHLSSIPTCGGHDTCKLASASQSLNIHRCRPPGVQLFAPSCASHRHRCGPNTDRTVCAWRSGFHRIPSPRESDACPVLSPCLPVIRRMQLRAMLDTHPPHS